MSLERGEGDMDDGEFLGPDLFKTELRHDSFDPRVWPWNTDRYDHN